jgi:hypothetical protein
MHGSLSVPRCAGIALALLLSARACARADLISWGYNWSPSAATIPADGGGNGWISLTDSPSKAAAGTSNTVVTNLRAFSDATTSSPDKFTQAAYTFTLNLQDTASQQTGSLTFSGFLSGTLTSHSANIANTLTSPATQQLTLGGNTYTVAIGTYTPPGPPGAVNAGGLNALVTVTPGNGGGEAPEPSTLILASLTLPWAGLAGWRRRKRGAGVTSPFVA